MFCSDCGAIVKDDSKFCEKCGVSLNVNSSINKANDVVTNSVIDKAAPLLIKMSTEKLFGYFILMGLVVGKVVGLITGSSGDVLFFGLFFGLGMASYITYLINSTLKKPFPAELNKIRIVAHGLASFGSGLANNGGWLYLLENGFFFKPVKLNIDNSAKFIDFKDIESIRASENFDLFGNKIKVATRDGNVQTLTVYNRTQWLSLISKHRK